MEDQIKLSPSELFESFEQDYKENVAKIRSLFKKGKKGGKQETGEKFDKLTMAKNARNFA